MAAIVVKAFNGLKPISDPVLLDNADAQAANNVLLNSGAMRPMNALTTLMALHKFAPLTIYRYDPNNDQPENSYWLEFAKDTDIMRSPIAQDQWDRLYWTDAPNGPRYAPLDMVITPAGDGSMPGASYLLGVPKPTTAPVITDFGAVVNVVTVTRVYCLTFFNATTGKESAPGAQYSVQAVDGQDVVFSNLPVDPQGDNGITEKRLYRKVPDVSPATTQTFRRIAAIPLDQLEYTDKTTDADAVLLPALPAASAGAPAAPKYPPTVSADPLPDNAASPAVERRYYYLVTNPIYSGVNYAYSQLSPMASIMADDSQTVTMSGMTAPDNTGDKFEIYRQDVPLRPQPLYLASTPSIAFTVNVDPVGPTGTIIASAKGVPSLDGPSNKTPPVATLSVNASTLTPTQQRIYMVTFVNVSGQESAKSPNSEIVVVLDGKTSVAVNHSEVLPAGTMKKRLYRQDLHPVGGVITPNDANWLFVAENTAAATSAVDTIATTALPGGGYAPALQNIPPTPAGVLSAKATIPASVLPETRVYCYTYVTAYDEEGAPSPSSDVISCDPAKDVTLTVPGGPPSGNYNITKKRIYRSATGTAATKFQFVGEIPVATTTFVDSVKTEDLGELLPSDGWIPPPVGLQGLRLMANGAAVGFAGNSLYFSEPNLPHAWPHEYPIDDEIIAIGTFGQSVAVLTRGYPYLFTGMDPEAMASSKMLLPQSCANKRSMVETGDGVLYASPDGMTMIGQGASIITSGILSRGQWQKYNPASMEAFVHNGRVIITYTDLSSNRGVLLIDISGAGALFTTSDINTLAAFSGGHYVPSRDILYFVQGANIVRFDQGTALLATWKSKVYRQAQENNFGFGQVNCDTYTGSPTLDVYADGVLRYTKVLLGPTEFRLPSGFKALDWEFQIQGNVKFTEVFIATSSAELQSA